MYKAILFAPMTVYAKAKQSRLLPGGKEVTVIPRFEGVDKIKISAANKDVSYEIVEQINNGIELQGRRI